VIAATLPCTYDTVTAARCGTESEKLRNARGARDERRRGRDDHRSSWPLTTRA
jgi:hypothetical protein